MILNKIIKTNGWKLLLDNETEIESKMIPNDKVLKEKKSANSDVNEMCIAMNEFEHSNDVMFKCFLNKAFLDSNLTP